TGRGPDVVELLLLGDVEVHVFAAVVLADDHALIDVLSRTNEEGTALRQIHERVRRDHPRTVRDERAGRTVLDGARPRLVAVSNRRGDARSASVREERRAEADEAARGNDELHAHPTGAV